MMNKILRLLSTVVLLGGIAGISYYILYCGEIKGVAILAQPSYYVRQSFWFIFLTGALVIGLSVLANFFSWNKNGEKKEVELKNAGFVDASEIESWLGDASGSDTDAERSESSDTKENGIAEMSEEKTEHIADNKKPAEKKTEVIPGNESTPEEKTEVLSRNESTPEEKTEILPGNKAYMTADEKDVSGGQAEEGTGDKKGDAV